MLVSSIPMNVSVEMSMTNMALLITVTCAVQETTGKHVVGKKQTVCTNLLVSYVF